MYCGNSIQELVLLEVQCVSGGMNAHTVLDAIGIATTYTRYMVDLGFDIYANFRGVSSHVGISAIIVGGITFYITRGIIQSLVSLTANLSGIVVSMLVVDIFLRKVKYFFGAN